jgi:uncharacterized membrane protein YhhN
VPELVPSVFQAKARAWQYWNIDGLPIITMGVAFVTQGVGYFWGHHHPHSVLPIFMAVFSIAIYVDQIFSRKIVGWLKARITYPRTGYAAPPPRTLYTDPALLSANEQKQQRKTKWVWIFLPFFLLVSIYFSVTYGRWYFAFTAILVAGLMWLFARKKKLAWYLPLPLLFCGFLLTVLPTDRRDAQALGIVAFGVQMLFMGVIALARYLREHPAQP